MTLDIQFKLKNNPLYLKYLHENSYWHKILGRNPDMWNKFVESMKEAYHLRATDKLNDALDMFDMISKVITTLK